MKRRPFLTKRQRAKLLLASGSTPAHAEPASYWDYRDELANYRRLVDRGLLREVGTGLFRTTPDGDAALATYDNNVLLPEHRANYYAGPGRITIRIGSDD